MLHSYKVQLLKDILKTKLRFFFIWSVHPHKISLLIPNIEIVGTIPKKKNNKKMDITKNNHDTNIV